MARILSRWKDLGGEGADQHECISAPKGTDDGYGICLYVETCAGFATVTFLWENKR